MSSTTWLAASLLVALGPLGGCIRLQTYDHPADGGEVEGSTDAAAEGATEGGHDAAVDGAADAPPDAGALAADATDARDAGSPSDGAADGAGG